MAKLDKALKDVLAEEATGRGPDSPLGAMLGMSDIQADADRNQYQDRNSPSYTTQPNLGSDTEPADKLLIQIQHHFINGEFDKANLLIQSFKGMKDGSFFSWYHMQQLIDWIRNIYKYTNMHDISKNYYDWEMSKDMEMAGVKDLRKVGVKEVTIDKFVKDAERVLKRKTEMK